jgi:hypothetical protein
MIRALGIFAIFMVAGIDLSAQSPSSTTTAQPPNPLALYRAFFHHIQFLESEAVKADALGQPDAAELRGIYQKKIGIAAADASVLTQWAATNVQAVQQLNATAQQIIQAHRAQYPGGIVPAGQPHPTPPPQLAALTKQRDSVTSAHIQSLKASLSADAFAKVDNFVQTQFSRDFKSSPLKNFKYPNAASSGSAN